MRALAVNAARGQLRAQQLFTKMLSETERALGLQKMQRLETALSYKLTWEYEFARRERLGITGPEPILHPDGLAPGKRRALLKERGAFHGQAAATVRKGI